MGLGKVQSAEDVARSLLKQLCIGQRKIPRELDRHLQSKEQTSTMSLKTLLKAIQELGDSYDGTTSPIYILLDAWDTGNMDDQSKFYEIEETIVLLGWRLFITSRSAPSYLRPYMGDALIFDIQADHNRTDIKTYVQDRISNNKSAFKLLAMDESLQQAVVDRIAESSQGLSVRLPILF